MLQTVGIEAWLVDRLPDGTEQSQYRSIQTVPGNGELTFEPVVLPLPEGTYAVEVKGFVQAQRLADGTEKLDLGLLRRVTVLAASPAGAPPSAVVLAVGTSGRPLAMPQRGDVISFEVPAPQSGDVPLGGHQFSVRIRVK